MASLFLCKKFNKRLNSIFILKGINVASAGRYSFTIEQGATTDFEVVYQDSDSNPIDLSGYQARMQIRPTATSDTVICRLSSSLNTDGTGLNMSGSSGTKPITSGSIRVFISAYSSSLFTGWENAKYDLEIRSGSGVTTYVTRILEGNVRLSKEVTRNGNP